MDLSGEQLKRWVKNLSKYKQSPSELKVLSRGANFAISSSEIPVSEYVAQTESACGGLPEGKANELRSAM